VCGCGCGCVYGCECGCVGVGMRTCTCVHVCASIVISILVGRNNYVQFIVDCLPNVNSVFNLCIMHLVEFNFSSPLSICMCVCVCV